MQNTIEEDMFFKNDYFGYDKENNEIYLYIGEALLQELYRNEVHIGVKESILPKSIKKMIALCKNRRDAELFINWINNYNKDKYNPLYHDSTETIVMSSLKGYLNINTKELPKDTQKALESIVYTPINYFTDYIEEIFLEQENIGHIRYYHISSKNWSAKKTNFIIKVNRHLLAQLNYFIDCVNSTIEHLNNESEYKKNYQNKQHNYEHNIWLEPSFPLYYTLTRNMYEFLLITRCLLIRKKDDFMNWFNSINIGIQSDSTDYRREPNINSKASKRPDWVLRSDYSEFKFFDLDESKWMYVTIFKEVERKYLKIAIENFLDRNEFLSREVEAKYVEEYLEKPKESYMRNRPGTFSEILHQGKKGKKAKLFKALFDKINNKRYRFYDRYKDSK